MRDMPLAETHYPMNLAETASIFFETVVGQALFAAAGDAPAERFEVGWYDCESAVSFCHTSHLLHNLIKHTESQNREGGWH